MMHTADLRRAFEENAQQMPDLDVTRQIVQHRIEASRQHKIYAITGILAAAVVAVIIVVWTIAGIRNHAPNASPASVSNANPLSTVAASTPTHASFQNRQIPDSLFKSTRFAGSWRDVATGEYFVGLVNPTDDQRAVAAAAGYTVVAKQLTLQQLNSLLVEVVARLEIHGLTTSTAESVDPERNAIKVAVVPAKYDLVLSIFGDEPAVAVLSDPSANTPSIPALQSKPRK